MGSPRTFSTYIIEYSLQLVQLQLALSRRQIHIRHSLTNGNPQTRSAAVGTNQTPNFNYSRWRWRGLLWSIRPRPQVTAPLHLNPVKEILCQTTGNQIHCDFKLRQYNWCFSVWTLLTQKVEVNVIWEIPSLNQLQLKQHSNRKKMANKKTQDFSLRFSALALRELCS